MDLSEKIFYLLVGGLLGFVLGRLSSSLDQIKKEVHEVDNIVKKREKRERDEHGFVRYPYVLDISLVIVILLCVWASFSTAETNDDLTETQSQLSETNEDLLDAQQAIERLSVCNSTYLARTLRALNERTEYVQGRADANVDLQKSQAEFLRVLLLIPPPTDNKARESLESYFKNLNEFAEVSDEAALATQKYPYPKDSALESCFNVADDKTEEDSNEVQ